MPESPTSFDSWAIVEIYGHQRYAGRVTEATIGGCSFVRVDIPDSKGQKGFTKFFGQGAIFSMTPVEEDIARSVAEKNPSPPVQAYELPDEVRRAQAHIHRQRNLPGVEDHDEDLPLDAEAIEF